MDHTSFTLCELLGKTRGSDYFGCSDILAGEMAVSGLQKGKLEVTCIRMEMSNSAVLLMRNNHWCR